MRTAVVATIASLGAGSASFVHADPAREDAQIQGAVAGTPAHDRSARSMLKPSPRLEASAFVGYGWFGADSELGNSWAPEQAPGSAPVVGARLAWLFAPQLAQLGRLRVELGAEVELAVAAASTGEAAAGRMSYGAPVFGWRGHVIAGLAGWRAVRPHLVLGAGGETVRSASPFMATETDPVIYWGAGATVPVARSWQLRLDLRHGLMPGRDGGASSTVELALGIGVRFGGGGARRAPAAVAAAPPAAPAPPGAPAPHPAEPPAVTSVELPAPIGLDPPPADRDGDGLDDLRDACPAAAETRNGISDDDGCPDELPPSLAAALAGARGFRFQPASARVSPPLDLALRPLLAELTARPELRITITGHPERRGGDDLAKRRAEAIKWRLVDQGIAQDRITTAVGAPGKQPIELSLLIAP